MWYITLTVLFAAITLIFPGSKSVIINVDNHLTCNIDIKDIPSNFICQYNDNTNERFNSTHAWFIQDNLRCIASIGTIKKIAGRNCHRVFPTVVRTPSKCGSDENGNPLKCGDVFN